MIFDRGIVNERKLMHTSCKPLTFLSLPLPIKRSQKALMTGRTSAHQERERTPLTEGARLRTTNNHQPFLSRFFQASIVRPILVLNSAAPTKPPSRLSSQEAENTL